MIFLADVMDLHLQVMQPRITAALADQLVVRAVLDDAAALEGDDAIDAADGRKSVGDDEHGPALDDPPHIVLDDALALVIESARRLVEDQNSRIHDEGAGDGDPLLLPAREAAASLADDGVITFGQLQDEVVRAGERGGGDDTLHRHRRIGERNVVPHRRVEEDVFLQHDSDLPAQPGNIRYGEIDAIDRDPPALRHIETLDKLGERALARTRRTDDAHHLARRYVEADVVQHLGAVDAVPEGDMLEDDVAADRRQCSPRGAERRFRHGVEDIAQPGNRQAGLVEILPNLRQAQHWGADATRKNVEGHELPDGEAAVNDELCPVEQDCGGNQLADELHGLARRVAEADHAEARRHVTGELLLPAALHLRFHRHRLERLDPGHALDQECLVLGAAPEFFVKTRAEKRRRSRRNRNVERKRAEHDECQQRRVEEHHREENEGEEQIDDEGQGRARQEIADVLELANARDRVADPPRLEIGDRQRHQVTEQPGAELDVDAIGRVGENVGAQCPDDRLEDRDRHQSDHQYLQRAHAAMHEHLVDDDLKEQWADQREDLQEERGDQHLGEEVPILVNCAQEPSDVEPARQIRKRCPPSHQNDTAIPYGLELGALHQLRARRERTLHKNLVLGHFSEHDKAAVVQGRNSWQGCFGKARPI